MDERERQQVPVDRDDLEIALTWRSDEWASYLSLRTGEVQRRRRWVSDAEEGELSEEAVEEGIVAGWLVPVEPLPSSVEHGWMAEFAATVGEARTRDRLEVGLDGRGALRRFKNVLLDHPDERERWFAFRDERLRAAAREGSVEHGIEPTTTPRERRDQEERRASRTGGVRW